MLSEYDKETMLLAIDTSTATIGLAIYDGSSVIGETAWTAGNHHTVTLAPAVLRLCESVDLNFEHIKGFGIALGPGSFTSLRVGLSFVKGMALGLNVPIIGVPTLDILAAAQPRSTLPLCAVLQAGRNRIATQYYRYEKKKWVSQGELNVFSLEEFAQSIQNRTLVSGELTAEFRTFLRRNNRDIRMATPAMCLRRTGFLAEIAWQGLVKGRINPPSELAPIYLHTKGSLAV